MAVVLENSSSGDSAFSASHTVSLGFTATAGRLLVVVFAAGASRTISSIDGDWTLIHDNTDSTRAMTGGWAYKVAAGGEADFTFTLSSAIASSYAAFEYSGLATTSPLDQSAEDESNNNTVIRYCPTGTTTALSVSDGFALSAWVPDASGWISGSPTITNGSALVLEGSALGAPIVVTAKTLSSSSAWSETLGYAGGSQDQCWASTAVFKQAGGGATVSVPSGSLTLAGYAPSVVAPQVVSVPAAALTLSAYAPVVSTPVVVGVPSATITLTGFAPVVVNPRTISVPAASLTLTGYAPDVSTGGAGTTIAIPAGALTLSAFAPTVATTAVIAIPSGSLTLTAYAPTVSDGTGVPTIVSVSLGTLTLTGFAPRVSDGSAPLGQKLDEYPRLPSDPYQISQKVTSLFSLTNTRVNELSTGSLWANYNASAAKPASTEGAWGDQRKNSRPVELGSPGSKYVVIGWVRLEADWADCRVSTGN